MANANERPTVVNPVCLSHKCRYFKIDGKGYWCGKYGEYMEGADLPAVHCDGAEECTEQDTIDYFLDAWKNWED